MVISWDCSGLIHRIRKKQRGGEFGGWEGLLAIPFPAWVCLSEMWFAGKLSIRDDEYMAWSPTMRNPANFHVPQAFGELKLV